MTNIKRFLTLFLIAAVSMAAWGATFTGANYSGQGGASGSGGAATATVDGVTISSTKAYYASDSEIREYQNGTLTVSSSSTMTTIVITCTGGSRANFTTTTGSITATGTSPQTWTGSATSVTFTASAQCRWSQIVVTTSSGSSCSVDPTVGNIMNAVSGITATGATFSTSAGVSAGTDCTLTEVGFVYNTSGTPTISDTKAVIDGYTSGNLNKSVTGLTPNTTYYVRAFATNGHGTSYSDQKSFTTEALPTYAIRFFNNGTQVGSTQNLPSGATAVKPSDPDACDEGYTFVGWWTAELDEDNTTSYTWVTDFTVSGAQDYYAVFSKAGTSGGSKTFDFATIATANSWVDGQDGYDDITISPINISVSKGDATNWARWWNADKTWRIYNKNTITISSPSVAITSVTSSPAQTFSVSAGVATLSPSSTVKFTSITVNYGTTYYTTDCGSACSTPTLTFGVTEVTKFDGDAKFTYTATPGSTPLGPGAITYTSSLPAVAEVNPMTGEVTIHQAMSTSPVVITATMAKVIDGSDCQKQVKATYTLNIYNKVTWMVNGEEYTVGGPTTGTTEGGEIETFPTDPNGAIVCDGKTFMGWTTSEYEGATAPATLYTNSSTVHITENTTFRAVFAETGGESETVFRKITSLSELTGGKRVLIINNGNYALDSVANNYGNVAYPVIIYGGKITVNRASLIWTVGTGSNGGYYFSQGENYLNSWPDSGGDHYVWVDDYTDEWTIVSGTGSGPFYLKSTEDDPYKLCKESYSGTHYFNVSKGSGTTKYAMDFYVPDIGYTNYATSCCNEVASPTATVLARSTTATISWTNQVEATNGYSLVVKEGETTVFEQTSIAAGTTSIEATGLQENTAHTFVLTAKGATCNRSFFGSFTTTDCDDVPYDIIITPALKSATFKWTAIASTATIKIYSDEDCITEVASQAGASNPATISGLSENTTYYVKIGAGTSGNCYGEPVSFTTTSTSLELAEWFPDSIRINLDADAHAYVQIEDKQEKPTGGTAKVAEKLFFAKYFEGEGSMKLISIYNGTDADEDLSTYKIIVVTRSKGEVTTKEYDLSSVNTIYKGQEIIFFTRPLDSEPVSSCADSWLTTKATTESSETDNPRWIECKTSAGLIGKTFIFNGDDALLLKKGSDVIDCFGASSTGVTSVSTKNCRNEAAWKAKVRNMDYGKKVSDYPEEVQADMDLYGIDLTHDSIELATARAILFRDLAVTSGDDAVAQNTTTFATFSKEWNGRNICGSGTTGKGTCNSFKDLGLFDYNKYYATFDSITTVDEIGGKRNEDGTYTIPIPQLDTLSCSMMRINVYEGSELKVSREYKVPIMVDTDKEWTTTDTIFKNKWHDLTACQECDVVILKGATLTKAENGVANDAHTIRNLTIYPGGTMNIPTSRTFNVSSVQFRVEGENVPLIKLAGTLQTSDQQVLVSRRINNSEAYFFSLPYDCNLSDIRWSNGEPAVLDDGFRIKEYDSRARADEGSTKGAPGHWKMVTGSTLEAGKGYQISVNSKYLKELIFPLDLGKTNVSDAENEKAPHGDNVVAIHQYTNGATTINNHNWNFIAQPYLCAMTPMAGDAITYGYLEFEIVDEEVIWHRRLESNQYLTMYNPSSKTYDQKFWSTVTQLDPFVAFFVQGKTEGDFTFTEGNRKNSAPARHLASQAEVDDDPSIFVGVTLSGNGLTDQANLRVRQDFTTEEYKLGYDLLKFTTYYQDRPQIYMKTPSYQLAFQAVSDSVARNTFLPMGVYCYKPGTYTFGLSEDYPIDEIEAVYLYDAQTNTTTNLLYNTYSITTTKQLYSNARFSLNVIVNRKTPQVTTDIETGNAPENMVRKLLINGHVYIQRGEDIYDVTGKQLLNR